MFWKQATVELFHTSLKEFEFYTANCIYLNGNQNLVLKDTNGKPLQLKYNKLFIAMKIDCHKTYSFA